MDRDADVAAYIGRWRPSSVSPRAAAFARDVITEAGPEGRERAKNLLWAAGKLADYGIGLGLEPVPEVLLHPSVAERFTRCAPGLSRRGAADAAHQPAVHRPPGGAAAVSGRSCRCPGSGPSSRTARRRSTGISRWRTPSPPAERRMRAAGLVCLGAGAGLIRGDLREVRGTDVACRSGGVIVSVRGARPRTVPVLSRYHARLLAAARFAGSGLVCGGADPGRRNLTNPLIRALDGGTGLPRLDTSPGCARPGWPTARSCWGWPRSCTRPGSAAPSGSVTWSPGWSRPARPTRCGCWGRAGHDRAGGVRGGHRRLRRRAADRGHAAGRRARPAAERPHPAGRACAWPRPITGPPTSPGCTRP